MCSSDLVFDSVVYGCGKRVLIKMIFLPYLEISLERQEN